MHDLNKTMNEQQVKWRHGHLDIQTCGYQNGKTYPWILPRGHKKLGIWQKIRKELFAYLGTEVQAHSGMHNLKSSWALCANLYFPFGLSAGGRGLLAGFLSWVLDSNITSVDKLELEYSENDALNPSQLLGEEGGARGSGQTSPDMAFLVSCGSGTGLVLAENKFVEHSFYSCSARNSKGSDDRPANPDRSRCEDIHTLLNDPANQCQQVKWRRKYWDCLRASVDENKWKELRCCPAAYAGYQLFRQQSLAEGIARSGKYDFVYSCVAHDERNDTLRQCLRNTGIEDFTTGWEKLFVGKAKFATWTHQQWVGWVREHGQHDEWYEWMQYVEERYGYMPEQGD